MNAPTNAGGSAPNQDTNNQTVKVSPLAQKLQKLTNKTSDFKGTEEKISHLVISH